MTSDKAADDEIEQLKKIDARTLKRFAQLDAQEQARIIALTPQPTLDPKVPKRDREIAKAQVRQLEAVRRRAGRRPGETVSRARRSRLELPSALEATAAGPAMVETCNYWRTWRRLWRKLCCRSPATWIKTKDRNEQQCYHARFSVETLTMRKTIVELAGRFGWRQEDPSGGALRFTIDGTITHFMPDHDPKDVGMVIERMYRNYGFRTFRFEPYEGNVRAYFDNEGWAETGDDWKHATVKAALRALRE